MPIDQKKKKTYTIADNSVEQLKEMVVGSAQELGQLPKDIFSEALSQIGLTPQRSPMAGEFDLTRQADTTNQPVDQRDRSIDAKIKQLQYVQHQEKEVFSQKQKQTEMQIKQLLQELAVEVKKLEKQTSELTSGVRNVTVESRPEKAGIYHVNFLEWVMKTLKDIRQKVNESRMWLNLSTKKKQQKGYWQMFKKHGTSFAMSEERAIASANG